MQEQVYEQLTLFPADSRANRSPVPGTDEARTMTVTSGLRCLESYGNSSPLGCLVRMCLGSSIWHSTRCLLTWKRKDTKFNRSLFQLAVSMPRTNEIESQFWPTPSTGAGLCGGTGNFKTLNAMARRGLITEEERRNFAAGNGGKTNPALLEWLMGYEQLFTKLIPTPTQTDYRGGVKGRYWTPKRDAQAGIRWSASHARMQSAWENWIPEPGLDRVVDGIPNRVDRIKCLGNAVVPQQFYPFFAAIMEVETHES